MSLPAAAVDQIGPGTAVDAVVAGLSQQAVVAAEPGDHVAAAEAADESRPGVPTSTSGLIVPVIVQPARPRLGPQSGDMSQ